MEGPVLKVSASAWAPLKFWASGRWPVGCGHHTSSTREFNVKVTAGSPSCCAQQVSNPPRLQGPCIYDQVLSACSGNT